MSGEPLQLGQNGKTQLCKGAGGHERTAHEHWDVYFDGDIKYSSIKEKMPNLTVLAPKASQFSLAG